MRPEGRLGPEIPRSGDTNHPSGRSSDPLAGSETSSRPKEEKAMDQNQNPEFDELIEEHLPLVR
ncbi:MAG: hypothetical protein ACRD0C_01105, partial [Acidimicrobiia bacterium]